MRICPPMLALLLFVHAAIAQEATTKQAKSPLPMPKASVTPAKPADSSRRTVVYRIKNVPALGVAKAVNLQLTAMLEDKLKHEGFIVDSPIVIIPEVTLNSLMVSAKPSHLEAIAEMIRMLDKAPTQIMIQVRIEEVEGGKTTVLSRPQVITLDGTEAIVEIGSDNKTLRVQLTPHVVQQDEEKATSSEKQCR